MMHLSTKGRCAVTAMIDVALRERFGPVPLSDLAGRLQISLSYLEQMFSRLRQQGIVTSTRGPGGGYKLGKCLDAITVADIITAVEEPASRGSAHTETIVPGDIAQDLWDSMNARMLDFTRSVTLGSLVIEQLAKGTKVEQKAVTNRGVFKQPDRQPIDTSIPNSVFALGRAALSRG